MKSAPGEGSARADSYGAAVDVHESTRTYAWCAAFVSWVMERTGATGYRSASVGDWVAMAAAGDYGRPSPTPPTREISWHSTGTATATSPTRTATSASEVRPQERLVHDDRGEHRASVAGQVWRKGQRSTDDGYSTLFIRIDAGSSTARPTVVNSDPARDGTG